MANTYKFKGAALATVSETVLLTDRYSLWFIDPIASGAAPAEPLKKTVSKWQFTYHITNQDFFYRYNFQN